MRFSSLSRIPFSLTVLFALAATDVQGLNHGGVQVDPPRDGNNASTVQNRSAVHHAAPALTSVSASHADPAAQTASPTQNSSAESGPKTDAEKMKHTFTTGPEPLTELVVEHYINTMEWVYDMKLTPAEKDVVLKHLISDWNGGGSDMMKSQVIMNDVNFSLVSVYRAQSSAEEQEQLKEKMLNDVLQLRNQPNADPFGTQVLRMYEAHHVTGGSESTSGSPAGPANGALAGSSGAAGGKLPEGMLSGVYASLHKRAYSLGFDPRFLVFFANGTVIHLPQNGLAGFDLNAYVNDPRTDTALVGRYRDYGNYISVIWNDNPGHRDQLGHNESGGLGGYDSFSPAAPPNGLRFSGVYYWGQPNGIQFNPDGTFFDQRAIDTLILPNPHFNNPRAMGGTYVIQDYTILLSYQDGSKVVTSFVAPAHQRHGQSFDWIAMHGSILYGQGYQPQP